jgi:hypothetical protein
MKILICGDSFAADWTLKYKGHGWPNLLARENDVTNVAQAGCSEYKIYKQLVAQNLDDYDLIIVSHTSAYRWYIETPHPVHFADPLHKNSDLIYTDIEEYNKFSSSLSLSSILYFFRTFYSLEYADFIHKLISEKIFEISKDKKVLHLTHIDTKYTFDVVNFSDIFRDYRGTINHYNDIGNRIVFERLRKEIYNLKRYV